MTEENKFFEIVFQVQGEALVTKLHVSSHQFQNVHESQDINHCACAILDFFFFIFYFYSSLWVNIESLHGGLDSRNGCIRKTQQGNHLDHDINIYNMNWSSITQSLKSCFTDDIYAKHIDSRYCVININQSNPVKMYIRKKIGQGKTGSIHLIHFNNNNKIVKQSQGHACHKLKHEYQTMKVYDNYNQQKPLNTAKLDQTFHDFYYWNLVDHESNTTLQECVICMQYLPNCSSFQDVKQTSFQLIQLFNASVFEKMENNIVSIDKITIDHDNETYPMRMAYALKQMDSIRSEFDKKFSNEIDKFNQFFVECFDDIQKSLNYLNNNSFYHNDLWMGNFLIQFESGKCYLIDFNAFNFKTSLLTEAKLWGEFFRSSPFGYYFLHTLDKRIEFIKQSKVDITLDILKYYFKIDNQYQFILAMMRFYIYSLHIMSFKYTNFHDNPKLTITNDIQYKQSSTLCEQLNQVDRLTQDPSVWCQRQKFLAVLNSTLQSMENVYNIKTAKQVRHLFAPLSVMYRQFNRLKIVDHKCISCLC